MPDDDAAGVAAAVAEVAGFADTATLGRAVVFAVRVVVADAVADAVGVADADAVGVVVADAVADDAIAFAVSPAAFVSVWLVSFAAPKKPTTASVASPRTAIAH